MRFISPNPGYKFTGKKEEYELLASGQFRQISPPYICEFKVGDTTTWERDIARERFKFRGVPNDESGVRQIDPLATRLSSFDTSTIDNPELRKVVEERLLAWQNANDHILAEKPSVAAPWPTYDSVHPSKIAAKVKEDGYDPKLVADYERNHKNRASVIQALEALVAAEPAEELVSA